TSLRLVRSPDAPKITTAHGSAAFSSLTPSLKGLSSDWALGGCGLVIPEPLFLRDETRSFAAAVSLTARFCRLAMPEASRPCLGFGARLLHQLFPFCMHELHLVIVDPLIGV